MKLKHLYGVFFAVVIFVLVGAVLTGFGLYGNAVGQNINEQVNQSAKQKATQLDSILVERTQTVEVQAGAQRLLVADDRNRSRTLERFVTTTPFDGVSVIDSNGTMLAIEARGLNQSQQRKVVGKDFSDRQYVQQALSGHPYVSEPVEAETGRFIVTISVPIEREDEIKGTVNAAMRLHKDSDFFDRIKPGEVTGREISVTAGETVLIETQNFDQENMTVGRAPVQGTNWTVAVAQSENAVSSATQNVLYVQAGAVVLVLLTLGGFGFWIYRSTIQQITELGKGFEDLSDQQYQTQIDLAGGEEWDAIEERFNKAVTELDRNQQELSEERERLNLALEAADLGMWDWNMETNEIYRDDRWAEMLGYEPDEIENGYEVRKSLIHPEDRGHYDAGLNAHMEEDAEYYLTDYRLQTKSGDWKWIQNIGKIVEWDGDTPKRAVGVHMDIDDRKRTQKRLRRNNELLQAIDDMLRHNVNNEMNVIRGYAEIIASESEQNRTSHTKRIIESSDDLLSTINKARRVTTLGQEQTPPKKRAVAPVLGRITNKLRNQYPDANIEVSADTDSTIEAIGKAEDAIKELAENAIIHSDQTHPNVHISVEKTPDTVNITIADDGPGIPEMDRNILTNESDYTPLYHGSGLGLWFVKEVANRSNADILVTNNQPSGTQITLQFLRVEEETDDR